MPLFVSQAGEPFLVPLQALHGCFAVYVFEVPSVVAWSFAQHLERFLPLPPHLASAVRLPVEMVVVEMVAVATVVKEARTQ